MAKRYPVEATINEYSKRIYWLALGISRNKSDAEDILQNTLIKIIRKLHTFRNRSQLSTWIYRVAYNESLMYLRKKKRLFNSSSAYKDYNERLPEGFTVAWSSMPDRELLDNELRGRIDAAFKDLPISYRMPLLLHRTEKLSLAEVSRILGIKPGTVKTRLHRAYLMVKDEIDAYLKDKSQTEHKDAPRCPFWTGFVYDYAQGKLRPGKKTSFKRHIKNCQGCNAFLDSYQQAIRVTGALECRDIPPELKEKVDTFFRRSRKK